MSKFDNKLKNISVSTLEVAIAKAISELTKIEYNCSISNITYEVIQGAKFEVHLFWPLFLEKDNKNNETD